MKIIIVGAGAIGRHLAKLFTKEHHDITLIDEDEDKLLNIGAKLRFAYALRIANITRHA